MPALAMHLHVVTFLGGSNGKISEVGHTINGCLPRGAGGVVVWSKRWDISAAICITAGHHLIAAFCSGVLVP